MNRFDIDFDGLRAQALNAALLNARPSRSVANGNAGQSLTAGLLRALRTLAGLWNRQQSPLPDHIARSRDRMVNAAQL